LHERTLIKAKLIWLRLFIGLSIFLYPQASLGYLKQKKPVLSAQELCFVARARITTACYCDSHGDSYHQNKHSCQLIFIYPPAHLNLSV